MLDQEHYETTPVAGAKLSDLDPIALAEYLQNYRRLEISALDEPAQHRLLENLNLLARTEVEVRPTIAGLLLFGKNRVTRWLPQNGIDCVKIRGRDLSEGTEDVKFFERNVFVNLEDALAFIYRYNTQSFVIEGVRRVDFWDYPEKALRECLVNALVHRDYTITGSRVRVHVFEDRIEVRSPGRLPNSLTLEKIQLGTIYHRNPVLVQFLYDAHLAERLGQGIPMIFREMKANGNPEPVFEDLGEEIKVTLRKRAAVAAQ
jgi:ATP-dependent DNA helicase RecG